MSGLPNSTLDSGRLVAVKKLARWVLGGCLIATASLATRPAAACGGFFCSANNPVNQAAERIIFAQNDDDTVTAVIEIQYQGPSESFSWLLPISSVPMGDEIAVASNLAFQRLQLATNPQYNLTTRVEGVCDTRSDDRGGGLAFGPSASAGNDASSVTPGGGVTVEASGVVGSFEWTVISVDDTQPDPADAAVLWLDQNGYDVPEGSRGLLAPYLSSGLYLLALKLQKGADAGSIRPIVLTYAGTQPMIPIKLTAVAANDDMGVMTWLLGHDRAVPQNYNALELNEARINWFNANQNYNQVVIEAANDAGGQGFVTELSGDTTQLSNAVWREDEESTWQGLKQSGPANGVGLLDTLVSLYGSWDGFWETITDHVTLPAGVTLEQLKQCPYCYSELAVDRALLLPAFEANVIQPVRLVQELLNAHAKVTRLYTTMSAAEMTVDPLFTFNPELSDVSNLHSAERVIECGPGYYEDEAPWRIELPQGGQVRGGPSDVGTWPTAFDVLPANQRIMRQGASGEGKVLEDNSSDIQSAIADYSAKVPRPSPRSSASGCSGSGMPPVGGWLVASLGAMWLASRVRRRRPSA